MVSRTAVSPSPPAPSQPAGTAAPVAAEPGKTGAASNMTRNTILLSLGTIASRILGLLRETMVAALFDISTTDPFFQAWRVPNAFRAMLAEGAARYAFNPVFG